MSRRGTALASLLALLGAWPGAAAAQPEDEQATPDTGFIGRARTALEIDDCRPTDAALDVAALRKLASEHYQRGETLYVQGDYDGAVTELVAAYCVLPTYVVLKDIGQAYERSLEYEKAIAYLERYAAAIGPDAKRPNACAPDPQDDKANVDRRVQVLHKLAARVQVVTTPAGATITIANEAGRAALASAGDQIEIPGGTYEMTIERAGYVPVTRTIEVRIGKPYTFFEKLVPLKGGLSVQVTPPDARVFLGDRLVGIGRYTDNLPGGSYTLIAEAPGRVRYEKQIEVLPDQRLREIVQLDPVPQVGRRQLVIAAGIAGAVSTGTLLYAFQDAASTSLGTLVGGGAGLAGAYFGVPRDQALGTSNLTITSGIAGALAGTIGARVFTDRDDIAQPLLGAGLLLGAAAGYYTGERLDVSPGAAAVFNSALLWGTTTGALFAASFDAERAVNAGLVTSGLGIGAIGGVLLARSFEISRTHALLIDIGGLAGIVGGLAVESVAYPTSDTSSETDVRATERGVNFALGGMAIGLLTAGVLTRNLDVPKLPVRPAVGTTTTPDGRSTTTLGVTGTW